MNKSKTIVVIGASGYLGGVVSDYLEKQGHQVVRVSRQREGNGWKKWGEGCIDGADIVINFAGKSVDCRWNEQVKKELLDSRVNSSDQVVKWISTMEEQSRPQLYICASGIGVYGDCGERELSDLKEESRGVQSDNGSAFLATICEEWEASASKVEAYGVRSVSARFGAVLGRDSRAWQKMSLPYRMFVGGKLGNGNAFFSWIHEEDVARAILHCIEDETLSGGVNFCAPAITQARLATEIGTALNRPSLFFVPEFVIKLAVGEFSDALLASINAKSDKLTQSGFKFQFPTLSKALHSF